MILIGGSGGGHRFDPALGKDFTHSALMEVLEEKSVTDLYGKNGHLWSRLLCGYLGGMLVFNVPGPFDEAQAAVLAFEKCCREHPDSISDLNHAIADAVRDSYGKP